MHEISATFQALVERQYGLATRAQLEGAVTPSGVVTLRRRGVIVPAVQGVWRFSGAQRSWHQGAMAACLAYGQPVAVHGIAAASLWGWDDIGTPPVAVAVPRTRSGRRRDVTAARVLLSGADITTRSGIPVTTPARTVVDVARRLSDGQVEAFLDHLLSTDLTTPAALRRHLLEAGPRSTTRLRAVRELVALRSDHQLSESVWEDRLAGWLVEAGLPSPVRQHEVVVGAQRFRLDLAYPEHRIGVEFDGWQWHRTRRRFDTDRERTTELGLAGWLVVQVTAAHDPHATVERVRRALLQRGWRAEPDERAGNGCRPH